MTTVKSLTINNIIDIPDDITHLIFCGDFNRPISDVDFMEPIIKYNFVDCKALDEIVAYLRRKTLT